tara:strand:+ start:238 stop:660 length:423 start_codon:yes stop_codon:yes gene_type:complete
MQLVQKFQTQKIISFCEAKKNLIPLLSLFYLFLKKNITWLPSWSCPFRHSTGIPGPTCFLTRSVSATLNGEIGKAFNYHLFGPGIALLLIFWSYRSIRSGVLYPFNINRKFIYTLGIVFLIYWIYRLISYYIFGNEVFPV